MRFFRSSSGAKEDAAGAKGQRLTRRSSGMGEIARSFASDTPLCVLDLGSTSPNNIRYMTERGHKI